jgi:hypothetical protein
MLDPLDEFGQAMRDEFRFGIVAGIAAVLLAELVVYLVCKS